MVHSLHQSDMNYLPLQAIISHCHDSGAYKIFDPAKGGGYSGLIVTLHASHHHAPTTIS